MAKFIRSIPIKRWGKMEEYQLENGNFVIASEAMTEDHGHEIMVFPSDGQGNVISWGELVCLRSKYDHEMTFENALGVLEGQELKEVPSQETETYEEDPYEEDLYM